MRHATELIEARAEMQQLRQRLSTMAARCEELEREVDDGERRPQHANESFRATLQEALSVHFSGGETSADIDGDGDATGSSDRSEEMTARALLQALRHAYEQHESHLLQRLINLQRRQWSTLDKARREAAAAETRNHSAIDSGRTPHSVADSSSLRRDSSPQDGCERDGHGVVGSSHAALEAIAAAGEEAAMSALQGEGRAVLQAYVEEVCSSTPPSGMSCTFDLQTCNTGSSASDGARGAAW